MKLWELSDKVMALDTLIESCEEDDVDLDTCLAQWIAIDQKFDDKALQIADVIEYQEALAIARDKEAKRLARLAKEAATKAIALRNYLANQMLRTGKKKIEGTTHKITLKANPKSVEIKVDCASLPENLRRVEITPDKQVIRQKLLDGDESVKEFADFAPLTHSISIK